MFCFLYSTNLQYVFLDSLINCMTYLPTDSAQVIADLGGILTELKSSFSVLLGSLPDRYI